MPIQPGPRVTPRPPRHRVELILHHLDRLPPLPALVFRLLSVQSDEGFAHEWTPLIESDAALMAGVRRMAAGGRLRPGRRAMSLADAVSVLGMRTVRNSLLGRSLFDAFSPGRSHGGAADCTTRLWEHSLAVACAAEMITERLGWPDSGQAFASGLLHDVGKMGLNACLPKSYAKVVECAEHRRACIAEVEREILGIDHTIAGKRLAARWGLPLSLQECIWLHHQSPDDLPASVGHPRLLRLVNLADNLVRRERVGFSGYGYVADVEEAARKAGLKHGAVARIVEELPARMEPLQRMLPPGGQAEVTPEKPLEVHRGLTELNAQLLLANERLSRRSACFEAIGRFTSVVGEKDALGDVCVAGAEAAAMLLEAPAAVGFVQKAGSPCVLAGFVDASSGRREVTVVDLGTALDSSLGAPAPAGGVDFGARGTHSLDDLWRRLTGLSPAEPLALLPIPLERSSAGVLIPADQVRLASLSAGEEWATVGRAIGLALRWAEAQGAAEEMTQELLDVNRRCREAEKDLVRMRSISMVAEMAAGAAHELNNPLAVISGRAQMECASAADPERRRAMEIVVEQAQRASQIVLDLMNFAKPRPPAPMVQPLSKVWREISQYWNESSGLAPQQLELSPLHEGVHVYADPGHLREILEAVAANAVGACAGPSGRVQINSDSRVSDETVRIVVVDNGPGMSSQVLEHAFDPFFSSRPAGRGRGMGLSRAYRLAEINGGRLWIESTENVGTCVTLELPCGPPAD